MKWVSGAAVAGALGWVGWHFFSEKATERPRFRVLSDKKGVELRQYESRLMATTLLQGGFTEAVDTGFHRLAGFIFGGNRPRKAASLLTPTSEKHESAPLEGERIEMTAPVGLQRQGSEWRMSFVMPEGYTLDSLPEPLDGRVRVEVMAGRRIAARRFSGKATEAVMRAEQTRLLEDLKKQGLRAVGEPVLAQYNSPFLPSFLRRNEILIDVEDAPRMN